jgi:hypothetical protein
MKRGKRNRLRMNKIKETREALVHRNIRFHHVSRDASYPKCCVITYSSRWIE